MVTQHRSRLRSRVRGASLLHWRRNARSDLGYRRKFAAVFFDRLSHQPALQRVPLSQLGPHQHPRDPCQRKLPHSPVGCESSFPAWSGVRRRLHLAQALADNQEQNNSSFGNVAGTSRLLWNATVLYDLPIGRGKQFANSMPRALDALLGGWRLSNIVTAQTGAFLTPYFPSGEGDPSDTGSGLNSTATGWDPGHRAQHADNVAGINWKSSNQSRNHWLNATAFTCPGLPGWTVGSPCTTGSGAGLSPLAIGSFGNSQVGSIVGPGYINLNTGLVKTFNLTNRFKLSAEGTFTNVLNHVNLGQSNINRSTVSFGTITSGLAPRVGEGSMR